MRALVETGVHGLLEANGRISARRKSLARVNLQILHRVRETLVNARTTLINQLRAVLLERGIILPKGRVKLMHRL